MIEPKIFVPYEIVDASLLAANTLALFFEDVNKAKGFSSALFSMKRVADGHLGEHEFTQEYIENTNRVNLQGNLSSAVNFIVQYDLVTKESLKKHASDTFLVDEIDKTKHAIASGEKIEENWNQSISLSSPQKTPAKLAARFRLSVSMDSPKENSCFCFRGAAKK